MIYEITNNITADSYVGYTHLTLDERFSKHKQNARAGGQTYLYSAMRKYGENNFSIKCLQEDGTLNEDESKWIAKLRPLYNMTIGGEGGDTSSSPNFKKAMEAYHKVKPKHEYATNGFKGRLHNESSKEAQSKARKHYWENLNDEDKNKRSSKIKGSNNGMFGKVPNNSVQIIVDSIQYNSKSEAVRKLNKSWHKIKKEHTIL